jgi:predicted alpha/beta-hydrolase family hydrolase
VYQAVTVSGPTGPLTGELCVPDDASALLIFAHGAGAPFDHVTMMSIAEALAEQLIGTLRFNFPFMQDGRRRVDSTEISMAAVQAAVNTAREHSDLPLFAGGHSFGGRMVSHLAAGDHAEAQKLNGLVFCSFPLHVAKKPAVKRAAHLSQVNLPMLFLSGTRDALADSVLLARTVENLGPRAKLHWLETADHGYRILKRQRPATPTVFEEIAGVVRKFIDTV